MLTRLFLFLIGYASMRVGADDIPALTKLAFETGIPIYIGRRKKYRRIRCRENDFTILRGIADGEGIELRSVHHSGVAVLWRKYRKRWGMFIGALVLLSMLIISDDFVWRIDVSGNENVSEEEILSQLAALGFYEGVYHGNIDFDVLHNRFLAASEDIAWIAVNMHGNVANVEVREYMPPYNEKKDTCANVVASCDGIITQISAFEGRPDVSIGESVKKGQLLISGVMEYEGADTRYVYAKGEVYAEVERRISVSVPLTRQVKRQSPDVMREYGIKIFSREIFFAGKGRIESALCDTITMYKELTLFGGVPLPISVIVTEHTPWEYVTETVSEDAAAATAYAEYKRAFIDAAEGVTLLSYDMAEGMSEAGDAFVIDCTLRVIANIAKTKEFTVE